jgi:hypothetical protein
MDVLFPILGKSTMKHGERISRLGNMQNRFPMPRGNRYLNFYLYKGNTRTGISSAVLLD